MHSSPQGSRGVNLGGWFIPERWMTPQLFGDTIDDTIRLLATSKGRQLYLSHIKYFITEQDFQWLRQQNVTLLRIPIAWWMCEDNEVGQRTTVRLDWVFEMASKYDLQILLDYHAAKGSQNGKDHSGDIGSVDWWHYRQENLKYIEQFAMRYKNETSLWGFELLNEPVAKRHYLKLLRFYRQANRRIKRILPKDVRVVYHDAFQPILFVWALGRATIDLHLYEVPVKTHDSIESYMDRRDRVYARRIWWIKKFQPVIIGEWSGVLPHSLIETAIHTEKSQIVLANNERQRHIYDGVDAHFFWSYKANDKEMWSLNPGAKT